MKNSIKNLIRNKRHVIISTNLPLKQHFDGIIFKNAHNFIGIYSFIDFQYDGILFISKKIIKDIQDSDDKTLINKLIRFNGEYKKCKKLKWINNVNNLSKLISEIKKHNTWPGIQMFERKHKTALYIGPITRIHKNHFGIYCYTSKGIWEAEYKLEYNKIYLIGIYDRYTIPFNKYMQIYNPFTKIKST